VPAGAFARIAVEPAIDGRSRSLLLALRRRRPALQLDDPQPRVLPRNRGRHEPYLQADGAGSRRGQSRTDREIVLSGADVIDAVELDVRPDARRNDSGGARSLRRGRTVERAITQAWDAVGVQERTVTRRHDFAQSGNRVRHCLQLVDREPQWLIGITASAGTSSLRISQWVFDFYRPHRRRSGARHLLRSAVRSVFTSAALVARPCWRKPTRAARFASNLSGDTSGSAQITFTATDEAGRPVVFNTARTPLQAKVAPIEQRVIRPAALLLGIALALPAPTARAQVGALDRPRLRERQRLVPADGEFLEHRAADQISPESSVVDTSYKTRNVPGFEAGGGGSSLAQSRRRPERLTVLEKDRGRCVRSDPAPVLLQPREGGLRRRLRTHPRRDGCPPAGRSGWRRCGIGGSSRSAGGPSWFSVGQDLVSDVTVTQTYPYDTAAFASATAVHRSRSRVGFNAAPT